MSSLLRPCPDGFLVDLEHRGRVKQALLGIGYPVTDRAGLVRGEPLSVALRTDVFRPYDHQRRAVDAFVDAGSHGVVVLACGAGKTVVARSKTGGDRVVALLPERILERGANVALLGVDPDTQQNRSHPLANVLCVRRARPPA